MTEKYLTPDSPDAWLDFPEVNRDKIDKYYPSMTKLCPVCRGHGGWNLRVNTYSLGGLENTAKNRHNHSHFRASCSHCNGWGWVHPDNTCTGHKWVHVANTGKCLNLYKCSECGAEWEVDSSD